MHQRADLDEAHVNGTAELSTSAFGSKPKLRFAGDRLNLGLTTELTMKTALERFTENFFRMTPEDWFMAGVCFVGVTGVGLGNVAALLQAESEQFSMVTAEVVARLDSSSAVTDMEAAIKGLRVQVGLEGTETVRQLDIQADLMGRMAENLREAITEFKGGRPAEAVAALDEVQSAVAVYNAEIGNSATAMRGAFTDANMMEAFQQKVHELRDAIGETTQVAEEKSLWERYKDRYQ